MAMIKRKMFVGGIVLVLIIIFIGVIGVQARFLAAHQTKALLTPQAANITLEIFSGNVFITDSTTGKETQAVTNQPVNVGSSIRTDATGRAQVLYSGGTVTRIDHTSSMTITKAEIAPEEITVNITLGRVWSRVKKLLGNESYETQTGSVVAAVRGTSYGHGILADGRNKITTSKHTVFVQCLNDTQSGSVTQNMKFFLDCQNGSPSQIIPIDDSDQDEWYQFNLEQDRLLDTRFGAGIFDDEGEIQGASASATPTIMAKPTAKPQTTSVPTPTQTAAPAQTPNPTTTTTQPPIPTSTPTQIPKPTPTPTTTPTNPPLILRQINPQLLRSLALPTPTPVPIR
jgi:hypothetical protein